MSSFFDVYQVFLKRWGQSVHTCICIKHLSIKHCGKSVHTCICIYARTPIAFLDRGGWKSGLIGFPMGSAREFHRFLIPHACMSFSARQSGAQIWNPSAKDLWAPHHCRNPQSAIRDLVGRGRRPVGHCSIASMIWSRKNCPKSLTRITVKNVNREELTPSIASLIRASLSYYTRSHLANLIRLL